MNTASHYDVAIIGAGMSGLAAGIRLAHFGKKVCIFERHNAVGGLNGFYSLGGRKYDVGLHALTNYVRPGVKGTPLTKLLRQLRIDRDRASNLGFDPAQVGQLIQVAMRGVPLREFRQGDTEVPVLLRFKDAESLSLDDLKEIRITRADGESVPLSALVSVDVSPSARQIGRQDRKTSQSITIDLKPKGDMGKAREIIESSLKDYPFPTGYTYDLGQRFQDDAAAAAEMMFLLLLSIVLIYMVMAALFESAIYPIAILISIMYAVVGVWWTFLVWDTTFSVIGEPRRPAGPPPRPPRA